jgi:hypothetical protein
MGFEFVVITMRANSFIELWVRREPLDEDKSLFLGPKLSGSLVQSVSVITQRFEFVSERTILRYGCRQVRRGGESVNELRTLQNFIH